MRMSQARVRQQEAIALPAKGIINVNDPKPFLCSPEINEEPLRMSIVLNFIYTS